jgi:outer membrane biosynthesis protein TonB
MFGFITKLFKSKEFYLQLDEAEPGKGESEAPAKEPEPVKAVVEKVKAAVPTPELSTEPVKAVVEKVKAVVPTPEPGTEPVKAVVEKVKAAVPTPEPAKTKSKKKPAKQPEPVKPAAVLTNGKVEPQPGLTFAPNYSLPLPTSRRRPGPSMNKFREMARGVKTPK